MEDNNPKKELKNRTCLEENIPRIPYMQISHFLWWMILTLF